VLTIPTIGWMRSTRQVDAACVWCLVRFERSMIP